MQGKKNNNNHQQQQQQQQQQNLQFYPLHIFHHLSMILFFQMKMKMMKVMSAIYLCTSPKELLRACDGYHEPSQQQPPPPPLPRRRRRSSSSE
jgi:hypothetical protein